MTQFTTETLEFIREELNSCIPQLSINCVIFRFDGEALQVAVVQQVHADMWTIPGGFVRQTEDIDLAAKELIKWISQRFVTIGYYSIVGQEQIGLETGPFFKEVKWINVLESDHLAMDHPQLVSEALLTLRSELQSRPLITNFMPEIFTIPELQKLFEAILGRPVDRGNFRQRILKSKILIKIGQSKEKTGSRPPILYKLNEKKYLDSLTQDVKLGF